LEFDRPRRRLPTLRTSLEPAKRRAEEIVGSTGGKVGGVTSARAGVFQITEPFSTEVSSFGVHNTSTRRKEITVTVHSAFRIR
jgi:uncharacterized protein